MLSHDTIKRISEIFCGDIAGLYTYKSGPKLVNFFNQYFGNNDIYEQGFPSRWRYVYDNLINIFNSQQINKFFNIILSKRYIIQDWKCSEPEAAKRSEEILNEFNKIIDLDAYIIIKNGEEYNCIEQDLDLEFIGSGGFANVYLQKSTGLILKKLKDEYLSDDGIRSRFKREYNITKSLSDLQAVIKVYDYYEDNCSYTMEKAEQTLEEYIENSYLDDEIRIKCIRQILNLFAEIHKRNIVHRDISPNNIFILNGILKVADFGLGKDLNIFTSHQTCMTNSLGQLRYCAPEQFMQLKEADKQSDVFSLGRLINYIMTGNSTNYHHQFKNATEKATNENSLFRYTDAENLLKHIEKTIAYNLKAENKQQILDKIFLKKYDDEVETYLSELSSEEICKHLINCIKGFPEALINYMKQEENHANDIILSIDKHYEHLCKKFENFDPIANLMYLILQENSLPYVVKELAAKILVYIANTVNRFFAQHLIESLQSKGIEPLLEEILVGSY
ncbi:serine/threonine protein kinase [bacterium]|nr:serine/threonine protein kinase [bacterium]